MTAREQLRYWGLGLGAVALFLWVFSSALTPFLLGAAIAYLMDPFADWLERHGFSRLMATVAITALSVGVLVLSVMLVLPMAIAQIEQAATRAPAFLADVRGVAASLIPQIEESDGILGEALANLREDVKSWGLGLLQRVGDLGLALAGFLGVAFVTPVVAFYLLMDWDRLVAAVDDYLPREHRSRIIEVVKDLDRVLAGFVRGQLTVCLILGTFYAIALSVVGLNFGLLIGLFAGLISFIPFVGSILGGALSLGVAVAQFWGEPHMILIVAAIFAAGQAVEGNYLTPKLVGDKVGLHPVLLMFALSAFGSVLGFVGLLIAVPSAAALGVVSRFLLTKYKSGRLYQGTDGTLS